MSKAFSALQRNLGKENLKLRLGDTASVLTGGAKAGSEAHPMIHHRVRRFVHFDVHVVLYKSKIKWGQGEQAELSSGLTLFDTGFSLAIRSIFSLRE
jgi:hypothetical protein